MVWRKHNRIELLKTIAVVTATVNPERAQRALGQLIEEMFPEQELERKEAIDKALEIMEAEQKRAYKVTKTQATKTVIARKIANRLNRKR